MELQSYTRVVTFKIDPELLEVVDRMARELSMSRSELIRTAITEFLLKLGAMLRSNEDKNKEVVNEDLLEAEVIII